MAKSESCRLAILGAGPIGLEAALYARRLNYAVTVYERGRIGEHLHRWGYVRLFSPFGMNVTTLGRAALLADDAKFEFPSDGDCITGKEHLAAYLDPIAHTSALSDCVRLETQVLYVGRRGLLKDDAPGDTERSKRPFRLLVREAKGRERIDEADVVLDCTGTYGRHRWLGDGGIPAPGELGAEQHIAYGLEDVLGERCGHYAGKNVLVVGAGYSAATSICNLARLAEDNSATWVIWLARGPSTQPLRRITNDSLKERDRLAVRGNTLATRPDGNVEFHNQSGIESIEFLGPDRGFRVAARCAGKSKTWDVDRIIANVGYSPDNGLYRELQVHECYASLAPISLAAALRKQAGADGLGVPSLGAAALRTPEPNFYILGSKSYGRNSSFLLRTGFQQVREVFTLITGKAELDLYKRGC